MEASALRHAARVPVLTGLSPHLRLQSDERLVALVRRGHQGAFEALLKRYQPRLLAFCRHMLATNEDAEDVLQEVFVSAYHAICADERPIKARPWLYRIARNRCLNHLRRPQDAGQESMDVFEREAGATAADTVHRREEFRRIIADVHELPESQRTALLLREIDTLSYDQIAEAMETTVPSVKSLLVRARMSLAEASEARQLTCAEARLQLTQAAEGIAKPPAPTRRHARSCARCRSFRRELRRTSHALAAVYPVGPVVAVKTLVGGGAAGAGNGAAGGSTVAGGALAGGGTAGVLSAAGGSLVTKTAAGLITAALVTAGAAGVGRGDGDHDRDAAPAPHTAAAASADDHRRPPSPLRVHHATPRDSASGRAAAPAASTPSDTPAEPASAGSPAAVGLGAAGSEQPPAPVEPAVEGAPPAPQEEQPPPPAGSDGTATTEGVPPTGSETGRGGGGGGEGFPAVTGPPRTPPAGGEKEPSSEPAPSGTGRTGAAPR